MKGLISLLTILLLAGFSTVQAQSSFTSVPAGGKYRLVYGTDRVIFQDTSRNPGIKSYQFKKAQIFATADKYAGGTVTVYQTPNKVIFKAKVSTFRVVGITTSDSLKVKSILETL